MHILDAATDRGEWIERWEACGREPFAHPAYCELFAAPGERPVVLVGEQSEGSVLLPLIIRPLPKGLGEEPLFDATSPYGYGGPFVSGRPDMEAFLAEFEKWLADDGLCSAFLRLSLDQDVEPGARSSRTAIVELSENVVVNLRRSPDEIWTGYEHKVRKNVKKALRAECSVRRDDDFADVDGFLAVYGSTMLRRGAATWYHFDREFFTTLGRELRGSYSVFSVLDGTGQAVSVELVLESDRFLYSFLGGTLEEAFPVAPNDLLKHEVILHGQSTSRQGFVLGGGYQRDDGIFRYKKAFDPSGTRSFRVAQVVGDERRYEALSNAHHRGAQEDRGHFFPAYRAPATSN